MPTDYRAPNINARRLGLHLRQVREALELSYDAAADRLDCDVTWLIRVETGFQPATPEQVHRLLDRYQLSRHDIREVLVDLASRPAGPPWLARHVGRMKALVRDLITLESESPITHTFGMVLVPELARSEAYARRHLSMLVPEVDVDEEWDLLKSRQRHRPAGRPRTLEVIVDESTLTLRLPPLGTDLMRDQLSHLLRMSETEGTTILVIPESVGVHVGLDGAFDVLEFPEINDRVSLVHGALGIDFAHCDLTDKWELLREVTLSPHASRDLIAGLLADIPARHDRPRRPGECGPGT